MRIVLSAVFLPLLWVLLAQPAAAKGESMSLVLVSTAFAGGGQIPRQFTCDGQDLSPPLSWAGVPEQARSLVLIVDDPDAPDPAAPKMTWVHWLLYNLPAKPGGLAQGVNNGDMPAGTLQGVNDWKRTGYGGPCPPVGSHRYFFKLYALDTVLPDLRNPSKAVLEQVMHGHVLEHAELMGVYQRNR